MVRLCSPLPGRLRGNKSAHFSSIFIGMDLKCLLLCYYNIFSDSTQYIYTNR